MKRKITILIGFCCLMAAAGVWVSGQPPVSDKNKVGDPISFNSISKLEIEIMLADIGKTNPTLLKRLAEDPKMKKQQIESLRQLLAFASQAQKEGLASDPVNKQEMDNIRAEILAVNYDREINKDKGPMPAFGFITDDQIKVYWGEKVKIGQADPTESRTHEAEFDDFLKAKIGFVGATNPEMKEGEISADEKTQARDMFARIRIYKAEFEQKAKSGELSRELIDRANLQVKLRVAQFLARLYSESVKAQTKATDEDIAKYIAVHPELDPAQKRAKAQDILDRAKAGENFAALANEFTEDPGNKGADGTPQGGLYRNVPKGRMVAPFETVALALQPGQVASELVESDFGFHIIKLERKLEAKGKGGKQEETYDVRHILISTGYKDPNNPAAREEPVKDYVRNKLETEKENRLLNILIADNNIQVPLDFDVPKVIDEQAPKPVKKQPIHRKRSVKKRS